MLVRLDSRSVSATLSESATLEACSAACCFTTARSSYRLRFRSGSAGLLTSSGHGLSAISGAQDRIRTCNLSGATRRALALCLPVSPLEQILERVEGVEPFSAQLGRLASHLVLTRKFLLRLGHHLFPDRGDSANVGPDVTLQRSSCDQRS